MGRMAWTCLFISTGVLLPAQVPTTPAEGVPNRDSRKPGQVELTVVDFKTNQPVGGATVELDRIGSPPLSVRHATSDEHGRAHFPQVEPGVYRIASVQVSGYTYDPPDTRSSSFTPIVVAEGAIVQAGTITVIPLGAIQGTVTDEMGEPVVGANVVALRFQYLNGERTVRLSGPDTSGTTDVGGQYTIRALVPERYYVRASVSSYLKIAEAARAASLGLAPVYYPNTGSLPGAVRIAVDPGVETQAIDFRLRSSATFHLRGTVSGNLGGERVASVIVQSRTPGLRGDEIVIAAPSVHADGAFDAERIPPGTYCLTFEGHNGTEVVSFATEAVTVFDRDVENLRLAAIHPPDVSGVVTLEEGASLRMPFSVNLRPVMGLAGVVGSTAGVDQTTGTFRFDRKLSVLPTDYKLVVGVSLGGYIKSMKFGGRDVTDGNINVSGGGRLEIQIG
jgi:hypothetical protein